MCAWGFRIWVRLCADDVLWSGSREYSTDGAREIGVTVRCDIERNLWRVSCVWYTWFHDTWNMYMWMVTLSRITIRDRLVEPEANVMTFWFSPTHTSTVSRKTHWILELADSFLKETRNERWTIAGLWDGFNVWTNSAGARLLWLKLKKHSTSQTAVIKHPTTHTWCQNLVVALKMAHRMAKAWERGGDDISTCWTWQRSSRPITNTGSSHSSMADTNEQPSGPSPSVESPNDTNDNHPTTNAPHSSTAEEKAHTSNSHPAAESPNIIPGQ